MRDQKNLFFVLIVLSISVIFVACNKGAFNPTPLDPMDQNLYVPKNDSRPVPNFKIYNWIRYNNTPGMNNYTPATNVITLPSKDLSTYGIHSSFFIVADPWLADDAPNNGDKVSVINETKFQNIAYVTEQYPDWYIQLDLEGWDANESTTPTSYYSMAARKDSLVKSIEMFKKYNTKSKIGVYSQLPINLYSNVASTQWHTNNDAFKSIYDLVDVFYPISYTYTTKMADSAKWRQTVLDYVAEIKRLRTNPKPYSIILGMSCQYSNITTGTDPNTVTVGGPFVEPEYITFQLETALAAGVDGVFFWTSNTPVPISGYIPPTGSNANFMYFEKDMPWFKAVVQFVNKYNIQ